MATGGYKCVQFQWAGGRTDTLSERLNYVLTGIVDAIVNSGTGWALDTDMGQTSSSWYHELNMSTATKYAMVKFIIHSSSQTRLAIGYNSDNIVPSTSIQDTDKIKVSSSVYINIHGLFVSACDSSETFTTSTGTITLPAHATRWISTVVQSSSMSGGNTFIYQNQYTYTYNMIIKGGQIVFLYRSSNWTAGLLKGFAIGRLIGTLAHSTEDTHSENNLCCMLLGGYNGPETTAPSTYYINGESNYFGLSGFNCFFKAYSSSFTPTTDYAISYIDDGSTDAYMAICNQEQLSIRVADPEAGTGGRWAPLEVYLASTDPVTCGVVSGDGFKGYLDTDFIRGVTINTYSKGQTFGDNAEFVYIGGGIAIGWDSTNTISLF